MLRLMILAASRNHGLSVADLTGPSRRREIAWPRQGVMRAARLAGYSSTQIGRALGGRDHATVLYGAKAAASREWDGAPGDRAGLLAAVEREAAGCA
jgi:chromosomal replication initiation ATPase DnaA